jgi:excisionase family DNA binding protein
MGETLVYSVEEAGKILSLSRSTAYKLVHTGELPAIRLGRRLVVPKIQVERLLNGKKDGQADVKPL